VIKDTAGGLGGTGYFELVHLKVLLSLSSNRFDILLKIGHQKNCANFQTAKPVSHFFFDTTGAIGKAALCSADNRKRLPVYKKKRR